MWRQRRATAWIPPFMLIVCLMSNSSALTTFGRATWQAAHLNPLPPPPARECAQQSDCAGVAAASCVRTAFDPRTRCLCGDNLPPINGQCKYTTKGLHHVCTDSVECAKGMKCVAPDVTVMTNGLEAPHSDWSPPSSDKLCLCAEEDGYVEKDFYCYELAALI